MKRFLAYLRRAWEDTSPISSPVAETPLARHGNAGKQLESLDIVEDATALLRTSGLNWILLVGTHQNASTIESDLSNEAAEMLTEWNGNGVLGDDFAKHLREVYPK